MLIEGEFYCAYSNRQQIKKKVNTFFWDMSKKTGIIKQAKRRQACELFRKANLVKVSRVKKDRWGWKAFFWGFKYRSKVIENWFFVKWSYELIFWANVLMVPSMKFDAKTCFWSDSAVFHLSLIQTLFSSHSSSLSAQTSTRFMSLPTIANVPQHSR